MHKSGYLGMPITKGLPYGYFMKQIIFEIIEDGRLDQLQNKWKALPPNCDTSQNGKSLGLEKLISTFIITLIGIINAIIILFVEKIFYACAERKSHVSIEKANEKKLEVFFKKFLSNLKKDEIFLKSPNITMNSLIMEMKNHNVLLNNAYDTENNE